MEKTWRKLTSPLPAASASTVLAELTGKAGQQSTLSNSVTAADVTATRDVTVKTQGTS